MLVSICERAGTVFSADISARVDERELRDAQGNVLIKVDGRGEIAVSLAEYGTHETLHGVGTKQKGDMSQGDDVGEAKIGTDGSINGYTPARNAYVAMFLHIGWEAAKRDDHELFEYCNSKIDHGNITADEFRWILDRSEVARRFYSERLRPTAALGRGITWLAHIFDFQDVLGTRCYLKLRVDELDTVYTITNLHGRGTVKYALREEWIESTYQALQSKLNDESSPASSTEVQ